MKIEAQFKSNKLAILIDTDNATGNIIEALLKEVPKHGTAHVKRVYGDWTSPHLNSSDFTRLANRIRESGLIVYEFGEEKTPESFQKACN